MGAFNFLDKLLPSVNKLDKSDFRREVENIRKELIENTSPEYVTASVIFSKRKFNSKTVDTYNKDFINKCETKIKGNFIQIINELLQNVSYNLNTIEESLEDKVNAVIHKEYISFYEANVLRYIALVSFSLKYSRLLLRWALNEETEASDTTAAEYNEKINKVEMDFLYADKLFFIHVIGIVGREKTYLKNALSKLPADIVNPPNVDKYSGLSGSNSVDLFGSSFDAINLNPFLMFGRMYSEWQVAKYDVAREERRMLEMKLMNLKLLSENTPDPKLQLSIKYNADRLDKLNYKISEMEQEYA